MYQRGVSSKLVIRSEAVYKNHMMCPVVLNTCIYCLSQCNGRWQELSSLDNMTAFILDDCFGVLGGGLVSGSIAFIFAFGILRKVA